MKAIFAWRAKRQTPIFQIFKSRQTPERQNRPKTTPKRQKFYFTKARKTSVYLFLAPQAKIFELSRVPEAKIHTFLAPTPKIMEIC